MLMEFLRQNAHYAKAAEGEFPVRVPRLQPEPKARDATDKSRNTFRQVEYSIFHDKWKKITFRTLSHAESNTYRNSVEILSAFYLFTIM